MELAYYAASAILFVSSCFGVYRIVLGPSILDRILALDFLSILCLAATAIISMYTKSSLALDVGLLIALTGFLSALFFCRFLRDKQPTESEETD